jgi:RHS repeat-associated protein
VVNTHYEYDPFGSLTRRTGDTSVRFQYRFSTKPRDFITGLYYYGYRWYDPLTGRWPSRDPIQERGGINLYGFVKNAPIHKVDYLGLVGQVCASKYCKSSELANFRFIPELSCTLNTLQPGRCYEADALYLPGSAVKVNNFGTIRINCGCRVGRYTHWSGTPLTTSEWIAGTPNPPVNNWPCGGANPQFPPYATNPPS